MNSYWMAQLLSHWGTLAEMRFKEITLLKPTGLAKQWLLDELEIEFQHAGNNFYFWRDYGSNTFSPQTANLIQNDAFEEGDNWIENPVLDRD